MTQQPTSIDAFHALDPHKVAGLRRRIAEQLVKGQATSRMVADGIEEDLQSVTPRLAELRRMGIVESRGRMENSTGKAAVAWFLTPNGVDWLKGNHEPPDPGNISGNRRRALERLLRVVRAVGEIRETRDGKVLVPMHLLVELGVAEQRYREAKHG